MSTARPGLPEPADATHLAAEFSDGSPGWMARGACKGEDPGLFFPISARGPGLAQVTAAKAVCFRCAVRADCLSCALAAGHAGIWGGTTYAERRAMQQQSGLPARADYRSTPGGQ